MSKMYFSFLVMISVLLAGCNRDNVRVYYESGELKTEGQTIAGVNSGTWTDYYKSGKVKGTVKYNDFGFVHGEFFRWYENGELEMKGLYDNGIISGPMELRHPNGNVKAKGHALDDKKQGEWVEYDTLGVPIDTFFYDRGQKLDTLGVD